MPVFLIDYLRFGDNPANLLVSFTCSLAVYAVISSFLSSRKCNYKKYASSSAHLGLLALSIPTIIQKFFFDFFRWFNALTLIDFILLFWPVVLFDFLRSAGKSLFLLFHALVHKINPVELDSTYTPKVSLIIPAYNEEKFIVRSIESALETDYPNKEIIVIDDGSTDRTYELAFPYSIDGQIKLIQRDIASGSKTGALNYGLLFAKGDVIITVDADTLLERKSIKEIVKPLSDSNCIAVSGNVRTLKGELGGNNLLVKFQAYEYLISMELGRRYQDIMGTLLIISGAFGAFYRENITAIGEFDNDTITEDLDITFKMRKLGNRLAFAENAIAWTYTPEKWKSWRRQRIRWARGQAETIWKHSNLFRISGFDLTLVLAVYDMLFVDIVLLFIRLAWLLALFFLDIATFPFVLFLSMGLYLFMELFSIMAAGILSPRKDDLKYVYLAPLMVIFYRPYYALIRLWAYLGWFLKTNVKW